MCTCLIMYTSMQIDEVISQRPNTADGLKMRNLLRRFQAELLALLDKLDLKTFAMHVPIKLSSNCGLKLVFYSAHHNINRSLHRQPMHVTCMLFHTWFFSKLLAPLSSNSIEMRHLTRAISLHKLLYVEWNACTGQDC